MGTKICRLLYFFIQHEPSNSTAVPILFMKVLEDCHKINKHCQFHLAFSCSYIAFTAQIVTSHGLH